MSGFINALIQTEPHQDIQHRNPMNNDRSATQRLRSSQRQIAECPVKTRIKKVDEDPINWFKRLIAENVVGRASGTKNPKDSARGKYNRRKQSLAHALHQMQIAIDDLTEQKGTLYKRDEVETLKAAIDELIEKTGLIAPNQEPPSKEELDGFMDMLTNAKPCVPPSREQMESLFSELGLTYVPDEDDAEDQDGAPAA